MSSSLSNTLGQQGTVAKISPGLSVSSQKHYIVERECDVFLDMVHQCIRRGQPLGRCHPEDGMAPPLAIRVTSRAFQAGTTWSSLATWPSRAKRLARITDPTSPRPVPEEMETLETKSTHLTPYLPLWSRYQRHISAADTVISEDAFLEHERNLISA